MERAQKRSNVAQVRVALALGALILGVILLTSLLRTEGYSPPAGPKGTTPADTNHGSSLVTGSGSVAQHETKAKSPQANLFDLEWKDRLDQATQRDQWNRLERERTRIAAAKVQNAVDNAPVRDDQKARLRDLLIYKHNIEVNFRQTTKVAGLPTKGMEFEDRLTQEKARVDETIEALVGNDYFRAMSSSFYDEGLRLYAVEFGGECFLNGTPLSAEEKQIINRTINEIDATTIVKSKNSAADPVLGFNDYDLAVFAMLKGRVSDDRIKALQDVTEERRFFKELEQLREADWDR